MSLNVVAEMGRFTDHPELKYTPDNTAVCSFTLAVQRPHSKDKTDFINFEAWRNTAEFICKYFQKGSMISVVGNLQSRSWENQEGKRQYATDVVVDEVYFTGSKSDSQGSSESFYTPQPKAEDGFGDIDAMGFHTMDGSEDDLPF